MFQCEQLHVAVTGRLCFVGLYNTGRKADVTLVMRFPSQLDTELGILVARLPPAPGRPSNSTKVSRGLIGLLIYLSLAKLTCPILNITLGAPCVE